MENHKSWYKSITIQSAIALFVAGLVQLFGADVSAVNIENVLEQGTEFYTALVTLIGSLVALYGRIRARHKLL